MIILLRRTLLIYLFAVAFSLVSQDASAYETARRTVTLNPKRNDTGTVKPDDVSATDASYYRQKSRGNDYKPMLVQGKTWKYSLVDWTTITYPTFQPGRPTERLRETRLEGYETIDGETYMKMNVYYDGSDTPAESNPLYYLREDTETGKIFFHPNYEFVDWISWEQGFVQSMIYDECCINTTGLLYDFNANDGSNFSTYETKSESSVTLPDGEHRCLLVNDHYRSGSVIEGIGFTFDGTDDKDGCSILGISTSGRPALPDSYYQSYLYEVVNGDGEVIYTNDSYRPGWWKGEAGLNNIMTEAKVSVTADGIAVTGTPETEASLYDMQGRMLGSSHSENGCLTIGTAGMSAGVYVLRLGSRTYKVAIR